MKSSFAGFVLALAPLCTAQSLNVNFTNAPTGPSASFGGAAAQPGTWNTRGTTGPMPGSAPLLDLAGQPTAATVTYSATFIEFPIGNWSCLSPDAEALYESYLIDQVDSAPLRATFDGLQQGLYRLYTYSHQPPLPADNTIDVPGSLEESILLDSTWVCPGQPQEGHHYVVHTVPVTNGRIEVVVTAPGSPELGSISGFQLVKLDVGASYCSAEPNSTGSASALFGLGSDAVVDNDLALLATGLPTGSFTLFLTSMTQDFVPGTNGTSNGNLCLGGTIGRFLGPGEVQSSGSAGRVRLQVDLTALPQGGATAAALPGDTWSFQCWHRDTVGLGSNLTSGLAVSFQ